MRTSLPVVFVLAMAFLSCQTKNYPQSEVALTGGEKIEGATHPVAQLIKNNAVTIRVPGGHCTGSLIAPRLIITAAHCISSAQGPFVVYFPFAAAAALASQVVSPTSVTQHASYAPQGPPPYRATHDLALLQLPQAAPAPYRPVAMVKSTSLLQTVTLLPNGDITRGQVAYLAGSGRTTRHQQADLALRFAEVEAYVTLLVEKALVFSAPNASGCPGDSGGPVYVVDGGVLLLAGVISLGNCDQTDQFITLAIDLRYYVDSWIPANASGQSLQSQDFSPQISTLQRPAAKIRDIVQSFTAPAAQPLPSPSPSPIGSRLPSKVCRGAQGERIDFFDNPTEVSVTGTNFPGTYTSVAVAVARSATVYDLTPSLYVRVSLTRPTANLYFRSSRGTLNVLDATCQ